MNTYDAIPAELKALPNWVCVRAEPGTDKKTGLPKISKVPKMTDGSPASSTDPKTWTTFEKAVKASARFDGIGFVLTGSGFAGVDIDHCAPGGVLSDQAAMVVDSFASYSEFSFSGDGVHILVKGQVSKGRHHGGVEAYSSGRYFTMSGRPVPGSVPGLEARQDELDAFVASYFPKDAPAADAPKRTASRPAILPDAEMLDKALRNPAFSLLWNGDTSGHQSDASRADLALCGRLAFWFGNDAAAIDRMFRQSGLMRPKWNRDDYRNWTIDKALARRNSDTYSPPGFDASESFGKNRAETAQDSPETAYDAEQAPEVLPGVMPMVQRRMAGLPVDVLPMGLRFHANAKDKAFREVIHRLIKVRNVAECPLNFSFGDAYNALPPTYGTRRQWVLKHFGAGYEQQLRKWGHVAGQWDHDMRRPGIPWSFYTEGAKLPAAEKKLMIDKHDEGQRPTVGEVRAQAADLPKAKTLPRDLKSALVALLEARGPEFVQDLLTMAGSGALDDFLAGDKPANEDRQNAENGIPKQGKKTADPNAEKNANFDDFPSKHCSESEQCFDDFSDDFDGDFAPDFDDADAPEIDEKSASARAFPGTPPSRSAGEQRQHAKAVVMNRSATRTVTNTAERFSGADPHIVAPARQTTAGSNLRTSADYESNGYSERFKGL